MRLIFADDFFLSRMKSPQNRRTLERLVEEVTGEPWKVDLFRQIDGQRKNGGKGVETAGMAGPAVGGAGPPRRPEELGRRSFAGALPPGGAPPPQAGPPGAASSVAQSEIVEKARKLFNGRLV